MLHRRFNAHYKEKKCPICERHIGQLYAQPGPLRDLGYPMGHYAHIQCVVNARVRQKENPFASPESRDRPPVAPAAVTLHDDGADTHDA